MNGDIVLYEFAISMLMGLAAVGFFLWAVFSGQIEDTEDIKYRIIERELDDEQ